MSDHEEILCVRLTLAEALVGLWQKAFDALLFYGINMRDLKEFKDDKSLDDAAKQKDIRHGQVTIMDYIKRVSNGIDAAIRRKQMRQV